MTVHVLPVADLIEHDETLDCLCGPDVEYVDEDGSTYPSGPLVLHHSLDGREHHDT